MAGTFILGLGAQKAGTTWLHDYLVRSPRFARAVTKELHVFDALDLPSVEWRRRRILDGARQELEDAAPFPPSMRGLLQAAMVADPRVYHDYFAGLLSRRGKRLVGDFTPDYALLSADRVHGIRGDFASRRVRTVGVFLMRDPVERTVSAIRMRQRGVPGTLPDDLDEAVLGWHDDDAISERSDYRSTLGVIGEVFPADDVHVGFYEELFTLPSVERLCGLFGVEAHPPEFDRRRNAAGSVATLSDDVRRVVARHHAPVYEAVAAFTGRDVAELWPSAALL